MRSPFYLVTRKIIDNSLWQPIFRSGGVGIVNRFSSIGIRLVTIPLMVNYLGSEGFGLSMTIASISGYISLLDFGLASALVNRLTSCYVTGSKDEANRYITAGMVLLALVSICVAVPAVAAIGCVDWASLLKLSTVTNGEASLAISIATIVFLVQLPLSVVLKVPYAMQRGSLSEAYLMIGNVLCFLGLLLGIGLSWSLSFILLFLIGGMTVASLTLLLRLVAGNEISLKSDSLSGLKSLLNESRIEGYDFFVMQAAGLLMTALQFTILAFYHGATAVATFSLLYQASIAVQTPFVVVVQPMWTKVAELAKRKEHESIRSLLHGYFYMASTYSILAFVFFLFFIDPILALVLRSPMPLPLDLRVGFAIMTTLGLVFGGGLGAVILGMNLTRQMAVIAIAQFVVYLFVSFAAVPHFAALGTILAICAGYAVGAPGSLWLVRRNLNSSV